VSLIVAMVASDESNLLIAAKSALCWIPNYVWAEPSNLIEVSLLAVVESGYGDCCGARGQS